MTYANPELTFEPQSRSPAAPVPRIWTVALLVGVSYYLGAKLGFALTLRPDPISTLWPPNTILLAALLLTPTKWWWALLLAALPAHLVVELDSGFPPALVLGWFLSNCSEALIGAALVRRFVKPPIRFDRSRDVGTFILGAAFLGTFLSTFLDVSFVTLAGLAQNNYWTFWRTRFLSNVLTSLTLGPLILTWARRNLLPEIRAASAKRYIEAALLASGLLAISMFVFNGQQAGFSTAPVSLYAPLPFLLWAAIRFGPRGTTACLFMVTFLAIWGAVHGHGPFVTSSPAQNAVSIQAFLIVIAIPFLVLAAVIGEREHADRHARVNEERLNLTLDAAQVATWEWRIANNRVSWSEKSKEIFGLADPAEATFEDFLRLVSAEDRRSLELAMRKAVVGGTPYECEFRVVRPDSSEAWVLSKGKALYDQAGRPTRLLGVNVDITERKLVEARRREEAALRESEAQFRELADSMPQIVWTATPDGRVDYFNRRWYELTGANTNASKDVALLMTQSEDREALMNAWNRAVTTGSTCEVEHRLQVANTGEFRWHLLRAFPVRDATGAVVRWYGSCTDIHDQKKVEQDLRVASQSLEARVTERTAELSAAMVQLLQEIEDRVTAEQALRSSEERFGKAFHSSPDAIAIVRQSDYRFIEVNEKWESMFGYSRADVLGHTADNFGLIGNEEDRQSARTRLEATGTLHDFELDVRNKSGKMLRLVLFTDTVDMAGEACYIITMRDVTERKRAEEMLIEQQRELAHLSRVAALGELSGAMAHELNQPLAAILTNARAAQRMIAPDQSNAGELREILTDIADDDRRAGDVIARLRSLLKKSDFQLRPLNVADLVQEVLSLLHSDLIQRRVTVDMRVSSDLPAVIGDKVQLQQVMLNLILNACDAMAQVPHPDRQLTIDAALTSERAVQLSVSDRGAGISSSRLEQIFDPFVTTKENGLGLGLAICRSIVAAHGGRLWAVNNVVQGATFFLVLNPVELAVSVAGGVPAARVSRTLN